MSTVCKRLLGSKLYLQKSAFDDRQPQEHRRCPLKFALFGVSTQPETNTPQLLMAHLHV